MFSSNSFRKLHNDMPLAVTFFATFTLVMIVTFAARAQSEAGIHQWYAAGSAGLSLFEDQSYPDSVLQGTEAQGETGATFSAAVGHRFHPAFRGEVEFSRRATELEPDSNGANGINGELSATSFMGNVYADMGNDRVRPYVGLGVGLAIINSDELEANQVRLNDVNETAFAFQVIAGGSYIIDERWALTADYRYFRTLEFDVDDSTGLTKQMDGMGSHNFMFGSRYSF